MDIKYRYRGQQGSQAVEFALILPFMILIIFCVVDFAIFAFDKAVITNASREAARRAVVLTAAAWAPAAIAQVACDYTKNTLITVSAGSRTATCSGTADPQITVSPNTMPAFGDTVTVNVSYAVNGFSLGSWVSTPLGNALTLTSSSQMRHE